MCACVCVSTCRRICLNRPTDRDGDADLERASYVYRDQIQPTHTHPAHFPCLSPERRFALGFSNGGRYDRHIDVSRTLGKVGIQRSDLCYTFVLWDRRWLAIYVDQSIKTYLPLAFYRQRERRFFLADRFAYVVGVCRPRYRVGWEPKRAI